MGSSAYYYPEQNRQTFEKLRQMEKERKEKERLENIDATMNWIYQHFRTTGNTLEIVLQDCESIFTDKELKQMDKSVIIPLKQGFKALKKIMKQRRKRLLRELPEPLASKVKQHERPN